MSGPDAMHDEMPGFFPGRPGGDYDEPLLDMLFERRPIPPGAPPEMHDLARLLATAAGPAEPGELAGEAAALAAFSRLKSPAGISSAVSRPARRRLPGWRARGRVPLAAAVAAVTAGLGGTAAAYAGVLPSPIQHLAHVMTIWAPLSPPDSQHASSLSRPGPQSGADHRPGAAGSRKHNSAFPAPVPSTGTVRGQRHGWAGRRTRPGVPACTPGHGSPQSSPSPKPTGGPSGLGSSPPSWVPSPSPWTPGCREYPTPAPAPTPPKAIWPVR
jgi:hypothetical protein